MGQTILVIDDDSGMREFLANILTPEGFTVTTAASGEEGITQAIATPPDLVLLDLRMPSIGGVEVCKALRANEKTQTVPILLVTGFPTRGPIEESMVSGADDFVCKPVDATDLLIRIRALIEVRDLADPVERLSRYAETIREKTAKRPLPTPPRDR